MSDAPRDELAAIAERDADAFARWLAGRELQLRASLRSFARSVDTEAVVQETLLRVWQLAPKVTHDGRPDPLFRLALRIARNLAIDLARRGGREQSLAPESGALDAPSPADPWLRERVRTCVGRLPRQPRRALECRLESHGRAHDGALAFSLGMRLNTFLQNVGRARRLLAECLARLGVDLGAELR